MRDCPAVTCLCPTYGRFERLRDAVACFLLQDYPGERCLLISCDQARPINLVGDPGRCWMAGPGWSVWLFWRNLRFPTLGHKRQALLEAADTALVAHWDDDDLYLPWHLRAAVERLRAAPGATCAKSRAAWWALGPRNSFEVRGPCHNVFEGQMVFERRRALELGGYPPLDSGQARALLDAFRRAGELEEWNPADSRISYVYRWADGVDHVSARKGPTRDADFGDGQPLIPSEDPIAWARERLRGQFTRLAAALHRLCGRPAPARLLA